MVDFPSGDILTPRHPAKVAHFYAVHMATKKFPGEFFVVINRKVDWGASAFHCVGYWAKKHPHEEVDYNQEDVQDVYIPWAHIAYIENTQYAYKG